MSGRTHQHGVQHFINNCQSINNYMYTIWFQAHSAYRQHLSNDDCLEHTVKPSVLARRLFREFREPNKTAKLYDANINCRPKRDEITTILRIVWFQFAKMNGAKIILCVKSLTFRAVKLKGTKKQLKKCLNMYQTKRLTCIRQSTFITRVALLQSKTVSETARDHTLPNLQTKS